MELSNYFRVNEQDLNKPLYQQVIDGIKQYISVHSIGEDIPSERAIAQAAGVNRETVRKAIKFFVERGEICRTRRGTRIAEKAEKSISEIIGDVHPWLCREFKEETDTSEITIALYEHLPLQKQFWQWCFDLFNATNQHCTINVEWVHCSIGTTEMYEDFLKEKNVDLFLFPNSLFHELKAAGMLAAMPDSIVTQALSDEFVTFNGISRKELCAHALAISFTLRGLVWNQDMMEQYGVGDMHKMVAENGILEALKKLSGCLPDDIQVAGNVWSYLVARGLPGTDDSELENYLHECFTHLHRDIKDQRDMFIFNQKYPKENLELFYNRKMAVFITNLNFVYNLLTEVDFELGAMLAVPEEERFSYGGVVCMGVTPWAANYKHITKFLKLIISDKVQQQIRDLNVALPVRKAFFNKEEKNILERISIADDRNSLDHMMNFQFRDIYNKLVDDLISVEQAVKIAMDRITKRN